MKFNQVFCGNSGDAGEATNLSPSPPTDFPAKISKRFCDSPEM